MKKKTYYTNGENFGIKKWGNENKKVFVSDFYEEGDLPIILKDACFFTATSDPGVKLVELKDIIFLEDK